MSASGRPLSARIASALATALMAASGAFVLWGIWSLVAGAEPIADPFAQGKADAEALKAGKIAPTLADPSKAVTKVPGYAGTDVPEKAYRDLGVGIEDEAQAKAMTDPVGSRAMEAALSRPRYGIDPAADPVVQRGEAVGTAAADITGLSSSLTGTYTGCSTVSVPTASGTWTTSTCEEEAGTMERACARVLTVKVDTQGCKAGEELGSFTFVSSKGGTVRARLVCDGTPDRIRLEHSFTGWCYWDYVPYPIVAELAVAPDGTVSIAKQGSIKVWSGSTVIKGIDPATLTGASYYRRGCAVALVSGSCSGGTCEITLRGVDEYNWDDSWYPTADSTLTQTTAAPLKVTVTDTWTDTCGTLAAKAASGACTAVATDECVDAGKKVIAGVEVERPCWRYRSTYKCPAPVPAAGSACEALRAAGCQQTSSECVAKAADGTCLRWRQTFSCPEGPAGTQTLASCGGAPVCLGGECADTSYAPNEDFSLAASYLGAIEAAAKDFDAEALRIFQGTARRCKESKVLGISTYACCNGSSGLAIDLNLSMCKEDERLLAEERKAGRCRYIGSYTKGKFWNKRKYHSYCCFKSKLGRIIQEQGRAQLGIGWGSPKSPSCRGLTPEELVAINWEALDLSEFYADVVAEMEATVRPTQAELTERVRDRILNGLPL